MADAGEIKAKVVITYDGSGVDKAKEDLAKLAESAGSVGEGANVGSEGLAGLDEQAQKTAESTQNLNSSITGMEKPLETASKSITGMTEAVQEHQAAIEETGTAYADLQKPMGETISMFQDAAPQMQAVQKSLNSVNDSYVNMASNLQEAAPSFREAFNIPSDVVLQFDKDGRLIGDSVKYFDAATPQVQNFGKAMQASAPQMQAFTSQVSDLNTAVKASSSAINEFGGVGEKLYGPMPAMKSVGFGEAFGATFNSISGFLNDLAMPLMAVQMIGMAVGQVGQAMYNSAAIAEGPAAHSFGTFTGTVDALGQSLQRASGQFSEGFGQALLPTLNALNNQAGSSELGGLGQLAGGIASTIANLTLITTGVDPWGGTQGLINQGAAMLGLPQPFQGPGPTSQYQQQMAAMPQTIRQATQQTQYQANLTMEEAMDPGFLASQQQAQAAQMIYQQQQQRYDTMHPVNLAKMKSDAQYNLYAQQQEENYQAQMNQPMSFGDMLPFLSPAYALYKAISGSDYSTPPPNPNAKSDAKNYGSQYYGQGASGGESGSTGGGGSISDFFGGIGKSISDIWNAPNGGADTLGMLFDPKAWGFGGDQSSVSGCFPAGTPVLLANGTTKPIEMLEVGEYVLAHDGKKRVATPVLARIVPPPKPVYELQLSDGTFLRLTDSHPISTIDGWKSISPQATALENPDLEVSALELGDTIHTVNGTCILVDMYRLPGVMQIYNIEVAEPHTFYAGGVLVHNKALGGVMQQNLAESQVPAMDFKNTPLMSSIVGNFSSMDLNHTFQATATWVGSGLQNTFQGVAAWVGQGLANTFQGVAAWVGQGLSNTFNGVANWVGQGLANTFQGVASWFGSGLSNTFQGVANWFGTGLQNTFQGIASWTGSNLSNTFNGVASWFGSNLSNTFKGVADWVGKDLDHTFIASPTWIGQNLNPVFTASPTWLPGFAGGVQNFSGGYAVVGERGPELVYLPQGSNVIPNHELDGITGGGGGFGGGIVINITHVTQLDGRTIMKESAPYLATAARQLTGGKR